YVEVDEDHGVRLFYYFIQSERKPAEDPLILWITGGPGCSALSGLLFEIDSAGGFSSYLAYSASSSFLPPASSPEASDDLADKLSNFAIADPISSQVVNAEPQQVSRPSETHLPGVDFGLHDSARTIPAEHDSDSTKNHLDSKVVSDNNASVQQEVQSKVTSSTSIVQMRQDEAAKVLGFPEAPGLFFVTTSEGETIYCTSSEYYSGSQLVNIIIDGLPYQEGRPLEDPTQLADTTSSSSSSHPSREVFMADRDHPEGVHNNETLSAISDDSRTMENEGEQAREARRWKNQARADRRQRARE
ncbi:hypothetical protein BAE44_0015086, partial [Dichanthelium oligosanthes]